MTTTPSGPLHTPVPQPTTYPLEITKILTFIADDVEDKAYYTDGSFEIDFKQASEEYAWVTVTKP